MKRFIPWIAVTLFLTLAGARLFQPIRVGGMNLSQCGALPVLSSGRVKPLDTVARTSLLMLIGRQTLTDGGRKLSALAWLLELAADPARADERMVFRVDQPELVSFLGKTPEAKAFFSFRDLRPNLSPLEVYSQQAEMWPVGDRNPFQSAVIRLWSQISLYQTLRLSLRPPESSLAEALVGWGPSQEPDARAKGFDLMARYASFFTLPPTKEASWTNLGESLAALSRGAPPHPGIKHWANLLTAYQQKDAATFSESVQALHDLAKSSTPTQTAKSRGEELFNRLAPFSQCLVLYLVVFLFCCMSWLGQGELWRRCAGSLLGLAFLMHTLGIVLRVIFQGRPPVTNLYSSVLFVGWAVVGMGLIMERSSRRGLGVLVASILGLGSLLLAHPLSQQGDTLEVMRAVLASNFWLSTHVVTITLGYGAMFLAGGLAHVYIFRRKNSAEEPAPTLSQMIYGVTAFALLLSFVGTVLGGIWADQSWGRFWGWDPKENGALLIVLWCAIVLHARLGKQVDDRGVALMAVFGNIVTAFSWFGVNLLGVGLHSYGFTDRGVWALLTFVACELGVIAWGWNERPQVRRHTRASWQERRAR